MKKTCMSELNYIFDESTLAANEDHLLAFRQLFESAFPDDNEREDFSAITRRVVTEPIGDEPHTFIILSTEDSGFEVKVTGGLIADWYANCTAIHLTYIAVDPSARGKNIAKSLIREGIKEIKVIIREVWEAVLTTVFFESNIPWEQGNDSFSKTARLTIFHRLGAKWIKIPYVQPPLDISKNKVKTLFLLVFPDNETSDGTVTRKETVDFLGRLYKGLGITDPSDDPDFRPMEDALLNISDEDDNLFLADIPGEFPRYRYKKVSVTWHFVENQAQKSEICEENKFCETFCSYEKDLMNFQGQQHPPFSTKLITKCEDAPAKIKFPDHW